LPSMQSLALGHLLYRNRTILWPGSIYAADEQPFGRLAFYSLRKWPEDTFYVPKLFQNGLAPPAAQQIL
jgi:hypothetical protein